MHDFSKVGILNFKTLDIVNFYKNPVHDHFQQISSTLEIVKRHNDIFKSTISDAIKPIEILKPFNQLVIPNTYKDYADVMMKNSTNLTDMVKGIGFFHYNCP